MDYLLQFPFFFFKGSRVDYSLGESSEGIGDSSPRIMGVRLSLGAVFPGSSSVVYLGFRLI